MGCRRNAAARRQPAAGKPSKPRACVSCHEDPFAALIEMLRGMLYGYARVIFEGKVVDVFRRTSEGFAKGNALMESADGGGARASLPERAPDRAPGRGSPRDRARPDLRARGGDGGAGHDRGSALRPACEGDSRLDDAIMRRPGALEVFGPRAFGLDYDFTPIEQLVA